MTSKHQLSKAQGSSPEVLIKGRATTGRQATKVPDGRPAVATRNRAMTTKVRLAECRRAFEE
jgi:hypothetical protein